MSCIRCKAPSETKTCESCKKKAALTRSIPTCIHSKKRNTCVECDPRGYINYIYKFLLTNCQKTDEKKGHTFDLDIEWINLMMDKQEGKCYHCKVFLSICKGSKNITQLSIDRVNNDIGHCKGNVVLSCLACNLVKRDKTFEAFGMSEADVLKPKVASNEVMKLLDDLVKAYLAGNPFPNLNL